jgi:hypothetical protein
MVRQQSWNNATKVSLIAKRFFLARINGAGPVEFDTAIDVGSSTNPQGYDVGIEISGNNVYATTNDSGDDTYGKVSVKKLSIPGGP